MTRKLTEQYKLPARTAPEVVTAFDRLLSDLQVERAILFHGRKLSGEAIINALVLDFLGKPAAERSLILARRVPQFEAVLRGEGMPKDGDDPPERPNLIPRASEVVRRHDPPSEPAAERDQPVAKPARKPKRAP